MIDKKELLFVVDEFNNPIEPKPRDEVHKNGYWHRVAHIWILNSEQEILCQKRSLLKDMNPGKWEPFFGGHMAPEEDYLTNAQNELQQELGIEATKMNLHQYSVYKNLRVKEFQGIYSLIWNGELSTLRLEEDEVDQVMWIALEEVYDTLINKQDNMWTIMGYEKELLQHLHNVS